MGRPRICVVGLGKLGVPLAATIASRGFHVVGVDVEPATVDRINRREAPVFEPGLQELIAASRACLCATLDHRSAIAASEITFVVVPTPSEDHGGYSLQQVIDALSRVGEALKRKDSYHLVVVTSTVLPGAMDGTVRPLLEERSGRRCGADFGLCYSPEFVALGSVVRDFLHPDFILIGESDPRAGDLLVGFYAELCENRPPVARTSFVNAELAKIALNSYVTMKIVFANMLAEVCERVAGADVDVVTGVLGLDSRIGSRYLRGALGYGGPCFPRDNDALGYVARQVGASDTLPRTIDAINRRQPRRVVALLRRYLPPAAPVAVLGLSYKPRTAVVEESQGLLIARLLAEAGHPTVVYDPLAAAEASRLLGNAVRYAASIQEALSEATGVVIANAGEEFASLRAEDFPTRAQPTMVLDCWRLLRRELERSHRVRYVALGVHDSAPGGLPGYD